MKCQLDDQSSPTLEEYSTDDEEGARSCGSSRATKVAASLAFTTSFLFDVVPNMYLDELCFMDEAITVSLLTKALNMVAFVANVQGETVCHVEPLLAQLGDVQSHVEPCSRVSVEEYVVTYLESYFVLIAYLLIICYNALVMVVVLKLVKAMLVVSHARLLENLEHFDHHGFVKEVKLMFISTKPCCEHSNVLEEDTYLRTWLEERLAFSEACNNDEELEMLSMLMEEVKYLVIKQGMVKSQKVTSASGGGSGGSSDQGGVSVHIDGVSVSAVGISASK
ncbi:Hypothetical predicted protein, partial [Olea europaea subsp. europaea]